MKEEKSDKLPANLLPQKIKHWLTDEIGIDQTDKLIIAISGGPDSTCLLHLLAQIHPPQNLTAAYIDHNLRPHEATLESAFVEDLSQNLGIPFVNHFVDTPALQKSKNLSIEEAARNLRYEALEHIRQQAKCRFILTGHTADDQVEEFFIRLIRGTGATGLSGMATQSKNIIRPLLDHTKNTLLDYLSAHNLGHCFDSSNNDNNMLRNRVRNQLLPKLEKSYNASIRKTVLQTASILKNEDNLIESLAEDAFLQAVDTKKDQEFCVSNTFLSAYHKAIQRRVLEKLLWKMDTKPSYRLIEQLLYLITKGEHGKETHLANGLRAIKNQKQTVFFFPQGKSSHRNRCIKNKLTPVIIEHPGSYDLLEINRKIIITLSETKVAAQPGQLIVDGSKTPFPLTIRSPMDGERFTPINMNGSKKINRYLSDKKIPQQNRTNYPVLSSANTIVAIAGLQLADQFKTTPTTTSYLMISLKEL